MMCVLFPRDGKDAFSGHGNLTTAGRSEDFGDIAKVEVGAEGFLDSFLLGGDPGFFVHSGRVDGTGGAAYSPCHAQIEKAAALDLTELEVVEGEYYAGSTLMSSAFVSYVLLLVVGKHETYL